MPAKYNVIPRKNPLDPNAPPKYYPSFVSSGRVSLRQLSRRIAESSTLSSVDVRAVLEALLTILPQEMANGNIVELGDFGTFRLKIKTTSSDFPNLVSSRNIIKAQPRFIAGKVFKQAVNTTIFEKVNG